MIGYSQQILLSNRSANPKNVGVQLGRFCINRQIPVTDVMEFFGVSKQTVYNWFIGTHQPNQLLAKAIAKYLEVAKNT